MKKKNMAAKRLLSFVLSFVMVLGMVSATDIFHIQDTKQASAAGVSSVMGNNRYSTVLENRVNPSFKDYYALKGTHIDTTSNLNGKADISNITQKNANDMYGCMGGNYDNVVAEVLAVSGTKALMQSGYMWYGPWGGEGELSATTAQYFGDFKNAVSDVYLPKYEKIYRGQVLANRVLKYYWQGQWVYDFNRDTGATLSSEELIQGTGGEGYSALGSGYSFCSRLTNFYRPYVWTGTRYGGSEAHVIYGSGQYDDWATDSYYINAPFFILDLSRIALTDAGNHALSYIPFTPSTAINASQGTINVQEGVSVDLSQIITGVTYADGENAGRSASYTVSASEGTVNGTTWTAPSGFISSRTVTFTITETGSGSNFTTTRQVTVTPRPAGSITAEVLNDPNVLSDTVVDLKPYLKVLGYDNANQLDGEITSYALSSDFGSCNGTTYNAGTTVAKKTVTFTVTPVDRLGEVDYSKKTVTFKLTVSSNPNPSKDEKTAIAGDVTWYYTEKNGFATNVYTKDTAYKSGGAVLKIPDEIETDDGETLPVISIGGCSQAKTVMPSGYTGVVFPKALGNINPYAFNNVDTLKTIKKNGNVQSIGDYAFAGCTALTNIQLDDITSIGDHAFEGCSGLTTATFPKVRAIGEQAFKGCVMLGNMDLFNTTTISANAFEGCTKMAVVNLGAKIETIGAQAFKDCTSLSKIYVASTLKTMGAGAFTNCSSLATAQLDADVDYSGAFVNCTGLTAVVLGKKVTALAGNAFMTSQGAAKKTVSYYFMNPQTKVKRYAEGSAYYYIGNNTRNADINIYVDTTTNLKANDTITDYVYPEYLATSAVSRNAMTKNGAVACKVYDISGMQVPGAADASIKVLADVKAFYNGVASTGQDIDKASVTLILTYNDYSTKKITGDQDDVLYDTTAVSVKGDNPITVTYEGFSDTFNVIGVAGKYLKAELNTTYLDSLGDNYPDWNTDKQAFRQNAVLTRDMFNVMVVMDDGNGTPEETKTTDFSFKTGVVSAIGDNEVVIVSNGDKALKAAVTVKGYNEDLDNAMGDVQAGTLFELSTRIREIKENLAQAQSDLKKSQEKNTALEAEAAEYRQTIADMTEQYNGLVKQLNSILQKDDAIPDVKPDDFVRVAEDGKKQVFVDGKWYDIEGDGDPTSPDGAVIKKEVTKKDGTTEVVDVVVKIDADKISTSYTDPDTGETVSASYAADLQNMIRIMTAQLADIKKQLSDMDTQLTKLEAELGITAADDATAKERMEAVYEKVVAMNKQIVAYDNALKSIYKKLADEDLTAEELADINTVLAKINAKIDKLQEQNRDLTDEVEDKNHTITDLEGKLSESKQTAKDLQDQVQTMKQEAEAMKKQLDDQKQTIEAANTHIGKLEAENAKLDNSLTSLKTNVKELEGNNADQQTTIEQLQNTLNSKNDEIKNQTATIGDLQTLILTAQGQAVTFSEKNREQADTIAKLKGNVAQLTDIKQAQQAELNGLKDNMMELTTQNTGLSARVASMAAIIETQEATIKDLRAQLAAQKDLMDKLQEESKQYILTLDEAIKLFGLAEGATKAEVMDAVNSYIAAKTTLGKIQTAFRTDKEGDELVAFLQASIGNSSGNTGGTGSGSSGTTVTPTTGDYQTGYNDGYAKGLAAGKATGSSSTNDSGMITAFQNVSTQLSNAQKEKASLQSENDKLSAQVDALSAGIEDLYSAVPTTGIRSTKSHADTTELTEKLTKVKTYLATLSTANASLGKENQSLTKKAGKLEGKNQSLEDENKSLATKNKSLTAKNKSLAATNQTLTDTNQSLRQSVRDAKAAKNKVAATHSTTNQQNTNAPDTKVETKENESARVTGTSAIRSNPASGNSGDSTTVTKQDQKDAEKETTSTTAKSAASKTDAADKAGTPSVNGAVPTSVLHMADGQESEQDADSRINGTTALRDGSSQLTVIPTGGDAADSSATQDGLAEEDENLTDEDSSGISVKTIAAGALVIFALIALVVLKLKKKRSDTLDE